MYGMNLRFRPVPACLMLLAAVLSPTASLVAGPVPGWDALATDDVSPLPENTAVRLESPGKFRMDADLSVLKKTKRAGWDFKVDMDLRREVGFTFDFYCSDVLQFTGFNVYLHSGKGWYTAAFAPSESGKWHRITVKKNAFFKTEGNVQGWGKIDTVRIAGWAGGKSKVDFGVANLSYIDINGPVVGVVRPDSCIQDPKFKAHYLTLRSCSAEMASVLDFAGLNAVEISDFDLDQDTLKSVKLLVFPFNPKIPKDKGEAVKAFVKNGGRIFACHSQDHAVIEALGLDFEKYKKRKWNSSSETPTREKGGFYLQHVWRYPFEDSVRQAYNLLVQVDPSWKAFLDAAKSKIDAQARKDQEWVASLPSKKGEWRAFWCHSARGLGKGWDWDSSIKLLKENGFNAMLPNLAWGSAAFYRSSVLPEHPSVASEGDAFDECIKACRKYGVECHLWKVCWRSRYDADPAWGKKMSEAGRTQVGFNGERKAMWLCPSHPANLKLEQDAFVELAGKGATGIHFDYIRYPDMEHCFCDGCRARFERRIGRAVRNWPKEIRTDKSLAAEWTAFRCSNITALVKGVSERVRREFPGVQISAAVFHNPKVNPNDIGQDWVDWCRSGYLDFICPMNYYGGSDLAFKGLVNVQVKALDGCSTKIRPGLGLSCWKDLSRDAVTMARQIMIVREAGLDGFCVFNFDSRAAKVLPKIHAGPAK